MNPPTNTRDDAEAKQMKTLTERSRGSNRMPFKARISIQRDDTYTFTVEVQHMRRNRKIYSTFSDKNTVHTRILENPCRERSA